MSANRMFILLARILLKAPTCFQTILEDNTHLWNCKYGHLSFKGLRTLQYKQMVKGLPQLKAPSKICTDCMVGKQHRDAIPKGVYGGHHKDCSWYMLTSADPSNLFPIVRRDIS
ncbi:Retrovirus-related Pol polyprotein from transposon TNT 1-94 [Fagus crenata]